MSRVTRRAGSLELMQTLFMWWYNWSDIYASHRM